TIRSLTPLPLRRSTFARSREHGRYTASHRLFPAPLVAAQARRRARRAGPAARRCTEGGAGRGAIRRYADGSGDGAAAARCPRADRNAAGRGRTRDTAAVARIADDRLRFLAVHAAG